MANKPPQNLGLETLGFPLRVYHILKHRGVNSIDTLCQLTPDDLLLIPYLSQDMLVQIEGRLTRAGLSLAKKPANNTLSTDACGYPQNISKPDETTINSIGLSPYITHRLNDAGIFTLNHLVMLTRTDLINTKAIGKPKVTEIEIRLAEKGLHLAAIAPCSMNEQPEIENQQPIAPAFIGRDISLMYLSLNPRIYNCLVRAGISTIVSWRRCLKTSFIQSEERVQLH